MKTDDQRRRRRPGTEEVEADQILSEEPSLDVREERKPDQTTPAPAPRRVPPPPPLRR